MLSIAAYGFSGSDLITKFNSWKKTHGKSYETRRVLAPCVNHRTQDVASSRLQTRSSRVASGRLGIRGLS